MNTALWAGFVTSLLLISHVDGKGGHGHGHASHSGYSSHGKIHSPSPHQQLHPSSMSSYPSNGGYPKSSFKDSFVTGLGHGAGSAVGNQAVNRLFGSGSSQQSVNHGYTNGGAPVVLAPSGGPSFTVVQPVENRTFPVIYVIIIIIGCIAAAIILFLLIKLLIN